MYVVLSVVSDVGAAEDSEIAGSEVPGPYSWAIRQIVPSSSAAQTDPKPVVRP